MEVRGDRVCGHLEGVLTKYRNMKVPESGGIERNGSILV
jgi:hypothetical protein